MQPSNMTLLVDCSSVEIERETAVPLCWKSQVDMVLGCVDVCFTLHKLLQRRVRMQVVSSATLYTRIHKVHVFCKLNWTYPG